jgi:hypothetical protein
MDELFHAVLSTMDMAITLSPAQTTIRILNDDGMLMANNKYVFLYSARLYSWCFDAVVKIGFRQQAYTVLESADTALICVDKIFTTDLSINVTINGSKSLAHTQ